MTGKGAILLWAPLALTLLWVPLSYARPPRLMADVSPSYPPLFVPPPSPLGSVQIASASQDTLLLAQAALATQPTPASVTPSTEVCWGVLSSWPQRTCIERSNRCDSSNIAQASDCLFCQRGDVCASTGWDVQF